MLCGDIAQLQASPLSHKRTRAGIRADAGRLQVRVQLLFGNAAHVRIRYELRPEGAERAAPMANYHSKMLQMVGKQVAAARKTAAKKSKKLSYKKHDDFNAFTYNQSGFRIRID